MMTATSSCCVKIATTPRRSARQGKGQGVGKSLEKRPLDTARLLTQTKFSIFEKNQQMTGVKGKKALDLLKQKRILISCKKSN
ncbi:hypothetical protein [Nitrosospira multiformis]|uniref:hypothetical protein n=1 Tax=Nitrosospira multiformis TaxID=1231 RepID=UPI00210D3C45|nr:hypothetical protein [Nitrosospira multiformis]